MLVAGPHAELVTKEPNIRVIGAGVSCVGSECRSRSWGGEDMTSLGQFF